MIIGYKNMTKNWKVIKEILLCAETGKEFDRTICADISILIENYAMLNDAGFIKTTPPSFKTNNALMQTTFIYEVPKTVLSEKGHELFDYMKHPKFSEVLNYVHSLGMEGNLNLIHRIMEEIVFDDIKDHFYLK